MNKSLRVAFGIMFTIVMVLSAPVISPWISGLLYTLKVGKVPEHAFWTEWAAIGSGFLAVIGLSYGVSSAAILRQIPRGTRIMLAIAGSVGMISFTLTIPFYTIATWVRGGTIPAAIKWVLEDPYGMHTYTVTVLAMLPLDLALFVTLVAKASMTLDQKEGEDKKPSDLDNLGNLILEALAVDQSAEMLHDDLPDYDISMIRREIRRLESEGKIEKGAVSGGAYLYKRIRRTDP